jgi:hypothetical protein
MDNISIKIKNYRDALNRYRSVMRWILQDSLWRFKRETLVIVLAGFFGATTQLAAVGQAIYYVRLIEQDEMLTVFGHSWQARSSEEVLVGVAVAVCISLILSACLIFYSRIKINRLRRKYEVFCSRRILEFIESNLVFHTNGNNELIEDKTIIRAARRDANYCGRVLFMLLETIIPFITFLIALLTLFYIHFFLTILISTLMGFSLVIQYWVNLSVANMSALYENTISRSVAEKRQLIERFKVIKGPIPRLENWLDRHFETGQTKRNFDAAEGRRIAPEKSRLISNTLFAIVFFLILVILGKRAFVQGQGWAEIVLYLIALRFCFANFLALNSRFTNINRFYPQFNRYFQFINRISSKPTENYKISENYTIRLKSNGLRHSMPMFDIKRGDKIALINSLELSRYTVAVLISCLLTETNDAFKGAMRSLGFLSARYSHSQPSRWELNALSNSKSRKSVIEDIRQSGLIKEYQQELISIIERPRDDGNWGKNDPVVKYALGLLTLLQSDYQWIVLDGKILHKMQPTIRKFFLKRLSDRIVVVVYTKNYMKAKNIPYQVYAVVDLIKKEMMGMGFKDWFIANLSNIAPFIQPTNSERSHDYDATGEMDLFDD